MNTLLCDTLGLVGVDVRSSFQRELHLKQLLRRTLCGNSHAKATSQKSLKAQVPSSALALGFLAEANFLKVQIVLQQ